MTQEMTRADIAARSIAFGEAPAGADPDSAGYFAPSPKSHLMEIDDYKVILNHTFKDEGQSYTCHQFRPTLKVCAGQPEAGASCIDFLPMPTAEHKVPPRIANRWLNMLKAFGFKAPEGLMAPPGFHLESLCTKDTSGRRPRASVAIVNQLDGNNDPKTNDRGEVMVGPKFFGYRPAADHPEHSGSPAAGGGGGASQKKATEPAPVGSNLKYDL